MNARKRAKKIVQSRIEGYQITHHPWSEGMIAAIEQAIVAAEEAKAKEEREACEKIIQDEIDSWNKISIGSSDFRIDTLEEVLNKIRARSEGEKERRE